MKLGQLNETDWSSLFKQASDAYLKYKQQKQQLDLRRAQLEAQQRQAEYAAKLAAQRAKAQAIAATQTRVISPTSYNSRYAQSKSVGGIDLTTMLLIGIPIAFLLLRR